MFVSSSSATQGWLLESICLRLQRYKSLPLSHYLQICPCNIFLIFTPANLQKHSQQKHPSHHAWRSVQSQGLEPIQTSCRRQDGHKSKERCLEIFAKTFALLRLFAHLFMEKKRKRLEMSATRARQWNAANSHCKSKRRFSDTSKASRKAIQMFQFLKTISILSEWVSNLQ